MLKINREVKEVANTYSGEIPVEVFGSSEPLTLRGLVSDWPLTKLGLESFDEASNYILKFYEDRPVNVALGKSETKGRVFYNDDFSGFNYQSLKVGLDKLLEKIGEHKEDKSPPAMYMASTMVDQWLPGFREENDIVVSGADPLVSIWMGNRSRIGAHYDLPDNIACSVVGRRRFTLFPPDQISNLYPGPLDFSPGGQAISVVDFHNPDYERFPKFRSAVENAQVVELGPGDAVFVPSMWWHHVESLDPFNVLINYWWRQSPGFMTTPMSTLHHALLTIRRLPPSQRAAWKEIFNHYIFESNDETNAHIPEQAQGILGAMDEDLARKLRSLVLNQLNR
jgi:hypothetical protein